jgi:hypothetical protein
MTLIRKMAGAGSLLAIAVLVMGVFMAQTASAQPTNPMGVYGLTGTGDVVAGDVIEVFVGGVSAGTSTAVEGEGWIVEIQDGSTGAVVSFTINGNAANETLEYAGHLHGARAGPGCVRCGHGRRRPHRHARPLVSSGPR